MLGGFGTDKEQGQGVVAWVHGEEVLYDSKVSGAKNEYEIRASCFPIPPQKFWDTARVLGIPVPPVEVRTGFDRVPLYVGDLAGLRFRRRCCLCEEVYRGLEHVSRVNTAETFLKTQGMLHKGNMGSENTYRAIMEHPLGSVP